MALDNAQSLAYTGIVGIVSSSLTVLLTLLAQKRQEKSVRDSGAPESTIRFEERITATLATLCENIENINMRHRDALQVATTAMNDSASAMKDVLGLARKLRKDVLSTSRLTRDIHQTVVKQR